MHPRTRRQKEVFDYIVNFIERNGHEPSYQLIARKIGVTSKAGIGKHVKALEDQGLLKRQWENRSFRLVVGNGSKAAAPDFAIDWLDVPANGREREEWRSDPFVVPQFIIRHLEPSALRALVVPDDAMSDRNICEGDIAIIERRTHARDGDCMAVTVRDEETLLRNYFRAGANVELRAANDAFEPVIYSGDSIEVHGVFRALMRPY
ncbi:MAG: hypothetical protein LC730_02395 [Acidobacteria bacterium]|nr:hypothetical protein [Acidobacteriota bacterium]MCA1608292.1 hypothetical protein [Acidobacteriota bacterium]